MRTDGQTKGLYITPPPPREFGLPGKGKFKFIAGVRCTNTCALSLHVSCRHCSLLPSSLVVLSAFRSSQFLNNQSADGQVKR